MVSEEYSRIYGPAPGSWVRTTHGQTHYRLDGPRNGQLVILAAGLGSDLRVWDALVPMLVSRGCLCLRYDFYDRGWSESDPVRYPIQKVGEHPLKFTIDVYTEQALDLLQSLNLLGRRFIHVGHSTGGGVGIQLCHDLPELAVGLVLISTVCLPATKPITARLANLPVLGSTIVRLFGSAAYVRFSVNVQPDKQATLEDGSLHKLTALIKATPRYVASIRSTNQNFRGFVDSLEPVYKQVCDNGTPVHLVWGTEDSTVPYGHCVQLQRIAQLAGNRVTHLRLEGIEHNCLQQGPWRDHAFDSITEFVAPASVTARKVFAMAKSSFASASRPRHAKIRWPSGMTYLGAVACDGCTPHGLGVLTLPDGRRFMGTHVNGVPILNGAWFDGHGQLLAADPAPSVLHPPPIPPPPHAVAARKFAPIHQPSVPTQLRRMPRELYAAPEDSSANPPAAPSQTTTPAPHAPIPTPARSSSPNFLEQAGGITGLLRALAPGDGIPFTRSDNIPASRPGSFSESQLAAIPPDFHIVVLGAGFGGLYTALRLWRELGSRQRARVTLVSNSNRFVFKPLLYEILTGEMQLGEVAPSLSGILRGTKIDLAIADIESIDADSKTVKLTSNGNTGGEEGEPAELQYDSLVVATGMEPRLDLVDGVAENSMSFWTVEDAQKVKAQVDLLVTRGTPARVCVIGAGYVGVEVALVLHELLPESSKVVCVERMGDVLPQSKVAGGFNQRVAAEALAENGVEVKLNTAVTRVGDKEVAMRPMLEGAAEEVFSYDLILWTAALQPNMKPQQMGDMGSICVGGGRLPTGMDLQVKGYPDVFALGDVAAMEDPSASTAQVAIQQSDLCARNIVAKAVGEPRLSFEYVDFGEIVKLGSGAATLASEALPGGGVTDLQLQGPLSRAMRRFAYAYRQPTRQQQLRLSVNFLLEPLLKVVSLGTIGD